MYKRLVILVCLLMSSYGCGGGAGSSYGDGGNDDTTPPTVTSTSPANNASCVATSSVIKATFSETIGSSFLNRTTFSVKKGGVKIDGSVNYGGTFATFIPTSLTTFTGYTATLTTGVKDSNGNPLYSDYVWGFTTGGTSTSTVSLATDIQPILNTYCVVCHQAGGQASFLPLTNDVSYLNLVNKASTQTGTPPSGTLVVPCDSSGSVLYQRVTGIGLASGEATMPLSSSLISADNRNLIKAWIDEGALDN